MTRGATGRELTRLDAADRLSKEQLRRAAELLSRTRHVHLRADGDAPPAFRRSVAAIDLWTSTAPCTRARSRDQAARELDAWCDDGVELALSDVATLGLEALVEEVYFPIFVRHSYCTNEASFPMNLDTLRRLARPDSLVATASMGGVVVAGCLLQSTQRTGVAPGAGLSTLGPSLDIASFGVSDRERSDAFFHAVLAMLDAHDVRSVRLRRSPWATTRDAPGWSRDLARAERLEYVARAPGDWFAWQPEALAEGEGILAFELLAGQADEPDRLVPWQVGEGVGVAPFARMLHELERLCVVSRADGDADRVPEGA